MPGSFVNSGGFGVPRTPNPGAVPDFITFQTTSDPSVPFPDLVPDNVPDFSVSRKRAAFASLLPALAFVPTATLPSPVYVNSSDTAPIAIQQFQYESNAEPVPLGAKETITVDKWQRAQSEPLRITTRLIRTANATFAVQVIAQIPAVYIGSQPTEPISVRSFQYDDLVKPIAPIAAAEGPITVDKWQGAWPQPYFRPKRLVQYGVNFAIAEQADDGLPPVHWIPPTNTPSFDRLRALRKQWLYPTRVSDQMFNVPITQTPAIYISGLLPGPISVVSFQYESNVSDQLFRIPTPPGTPAIYIGSQPTEPIAITSFQYEAGTRPLSTAFTETVTVDKWYQVTQAPRFDLKRNQRLYPVVVSDYLSQSPTAEIIRVDKWGKNYPDQVFRAKRLSTNGLYTVDPKQLTQVERTTLDKWYQPQSTPRRDVKRAQYLFQTLGIDTTVFSAIADWLAVQKDVRSITLYTSEAGTITLYLTEAGAIDNLTGDSRAIFLLVNDDGIIPLS